LRAERSLIQTIGRAARNVHGKVIMYADRETESMRKAITVTRQRRTTQEAHNLKHGITPKTIEKAIHDLAGTAQDDRWDPPKALLPKKGKHAVAPDEIPALITSLKKQMFELAEKLEFEKAAALRDRIVQLEELQIDLG
jgi:excinuclease ABC subunit B